MYKRQLYVIAQAVERIVEWLLELLKLSEKSPGAKKELAVRALGEVNSTLNGNPSVEDLAGVAAVASAKPELEKEIDEARTDISFVGHGVSILLACFAVNALNYGILGSLGATGVNGDIDRLITALAAAGGSKALHELVGRMQKAKEASESEAKAT